MIRIGLSQADKQKLIAAYVVQNKIKKVKVFYFKKFRPKYNIECDIEYIEYSDIQMYKFFYRLLEEIDNTVLLVFDGCMRTQNRSDLNYNCAKHYCNQTQHIIVTELFPFIDDKNDMMILFDLDNPDKFKGKSFDYSLLQSEDIKIKPYRLKWNTIPIQETEKQKESYHKKKESLFENLGNKDPDTIPRALQLVAGDCKKAYAIEPDTIYIARNKRHGQDNILSYADDIPKAKNYVILDTHFRRLDMEDFLKQTGIKKINYMATTLSIDTYIIDDYAKWLARLEAIYAKASLY